MDNDEARRIIDKLAHGINPITGEVVPEDSQFNAPLIIRALFAASRALAGKPPKPRRQPPPNAGKRWTPEDDARLQALFDLGMDKQAIAREMGRTAWAVEARLAKHGKVPAQVGLRVSEHVRPWRLFSNAQH